MDKRKENEIELLQTLVNRKGMQNILDTASRSLENPLFVCDLGYQIICRSDRGACCDEFWENVRHHSYGFPEQIGQIIRSGGFAEIGASDEPLILQYKFTPVPFLAACIRDGAHVLGYVCVYGYIRPFQEQDKELLILLCRVLSYEFLYYGLSASDKIPYYTLLSDLLAGALTDKEELECRLQRLKLSLPKSLVCAVVRFPEQTAQATVSYIREVLLHRLTYALGIVCQNHLVLLLPEAVPEKGMLESSLSSYEGNVDYQIGVSSPIANLLDLKRYYEQSLQAIRIAGLLKLKNRQHLFQKLSVYQILFYAGKETNLKHLCHPAVLEMQSYDRQHHTEYLKDLTLYLSCGKNIKKAAKQAGVHKNSMYYRISRLEDKFFLSLGDDDTCFALQLSLKILEILSIS